MRASAGQSASYLPLHTERKSPLNKNLKKSNKICVAEKTGGRWLCHPSFKSEHRDGIEE